MTDPEAYAIRHRLPHRIRVQFEQPLSEPRLRSVIWLLSHQLADTTIRPYASGRGLVICSNDPTCPLDEPLAALDAVLSQPTAHLAEPPPIALVRLLRQTRQGSLRVLIALAIAGWALPVLPGTPFFLLAWWLGWRPEPTNADNAQPGSLQSAIVNRGETSLAERHDNPDHAAGIHNTKR